MGISGYMKKSKSILLLVLLLALLFSGCGPVTVNPPSVAANRKMAFSLDSKGRYTFLPEARNRAIFLSDIFGNFLTQINEMDTICGWCDFSSSNNMLLYVKKTKGENGEDLFNLMVYNLKTEEMKIECKAKRYIWFPRWSPNGKYIAFCVEGKGEAAVLDWRKNEVVYRIKTNSVFYRWLPDGSGLLTVDILDEVDSIEGDALQYFVIRKKYFDPDEETEDLIRGYSRTCWPDISGDGNKVVFNATEFKGPSSCLVDEIKEREHVYLYDYTKKSVTRLTKGGISAFYTVISPDGARVAFIDYDIDIDKDRLNGGNVWICDVTREKRTLKRIWGKKKALYPFWCENKILGFVGLDPKQKKVGKGFDNIYIYDLENGNLRSLKEHIQGLFKKKKNTEK
jgi:dipeptidyl aminopeptidase/acylaminoacyl peptidase